MEKHQKQWAEWTDGQYVPKSIFWRRYDNGDNRFYYSNKSQKTIEPIIGIGITSAISLAFPPSPFIQKWKDNTNDWKTKLPIMADYGTLCHTGFGELYTNGHVSQKLIEIADQKFNKKVQFQKDMLSLRQFIIDYNVKFHLIEGILGKRFETPNGREIYINTAIDSFVEMDYPIKTKEKIEDGVYKRGDKKGEIKYREETVTKVIRIKAIVDLKSNFDAKETKSFYEDHKRQLIFGRDLIEEEFGIDDVKMFNIGTVGWVKEPKYVLKEHFDEQNEYGVYDSENLYKRLNLLVEEGKAEPKGWIHEIGEINLNQFNYNVVSYRDKVYQLLQEEKIK